MARGCVFLLQAVVLSFMCFGSAKSHREKAYCPLGEKHGHWVHQTKDGSRCILRCADGFVPSGCHIIRKDQKGDWNVKEIPTCVEASDSSWIPGKNTLIAVGAGATAVVAAPIVLSAAGFGAAGVTAGSLAAFLQGPATAAGGWFALAQSAGVTGIAATTKATIFGGVSSLTGAVSQYFSSSCEAE